MAFLPINNAASGQSSTWERPSDWLTLEGSGEFIGLKAVSSADINFLALSAQGDYTVDWGDGNVEDFASGATAEHIYDYDDLSADTTCSRGYRQAIVVVSHRGVSDLTYLSLHETHSNATSIYETGWLDFTLLAPEMTDFYLHGLSDDLEFNMLERAYIGDNKISNLVLLFNECTSLRSVPCLYAGHCINISGLFRDCHSLEVAPDFTAHPSSPVTSSGLFSDCKSLTTVPVYDTTGWDSVSSMFSGCVSLKEVPLIDTSSMTNFSNTFNGCLALETIPSWDTSSMTNATDMFLNCVSLTTIPLIDTSSCSTFNSMFESCRSLTTIPLIDMTSGYSTTDMFLNCVSLESIPAINTSSVRTMASMFEGCTALRSVAALDTSSVGIGASTYIRDLFLNCKSLITVPTLNLTNHDSDCSGMFEGCNSLKTVTLTNTSSVTSFSECFRDCISLTHIASMDTSGCSDFYGMFRGCSALKYVPTLDTSSGTNFSYMFYYCKALNTIPTLDTSSGTNFSYMFYTAYGLSSVPAIDVSAGTSFTYMFRYCPSLASGAMSGGRYSISYDDCKLSTQAIIDIFNALGTTATSTIVVSDNPGTPGLTPADIAIATAKNWTVTT